MSDRNKRLEMLGQRFSQQPDESQESSVTTQSADGKSSEVNRRRHSVYIDESLMNRIDFLFKEVQHEIYPAELKKSTFLEMLLEKGLEDLNSIKNTLAPHTSS